MTNPPIQIAIDFGEIEEVLQSIHAAGQELAGTTIKREARDAFTEHSKADLEKWIDQQAAANPLRLGHVYEYGGYGKYERAGDPSARLWDIQWRQIGDGAATATVQYKIERDPIPINPELLSDAAANGVQLATHFFYNKAKVLEEGPDQYTIVAGVQTATTRRGGSTDRPKTLVFMQNGTPMFPKRATIQNTHSGELARAIEEFFDRNARTIIRKEVEVAVTRQVTPAVEAQLSRAARTVRARSTPRISAGDKRIVQTRVKGRPGSAISVAPKQTFRNKVKRIISRFIE